MGRSKLTKDSILNELRKSAREKKELKKAIKAKDASLKKHFKKALRSLVEKGEISLDGKIYRIIEAENQNLAATTENVLPIGMRMRQRQTESPKKSVTFAEPQADLDDEIRRLEMELEQSSSSSSSSDDDGDDEEEKSGVIALSELADDHVEHLPDSCLPVPGRYNSRSNSDLSLGGDHKREAHQKKTEQKRKDGLKEAVNEVLNGYRARSSEKIPFYCRFCAKQYRNEQEFFEHKNSEFHQTAVQMERRATFCRLCLKQLTSPAQMKEHLSSRPHKERLESIRSKQRAQAKFNKKTKKGNAARQWT